ncbi:MAG TPA: PAS domain S-box protein [Pyrinomonadaceae bacterium]|jgi:PAS domain S-box-containing protein|nr:PAS domain S-box protein [Pyrinomonadaceae bacterium]
MSSLKDSEVKRGRAEERLRRQLDFTRAITNSLGEGVYALDREGCVTFMNRAAEQLLGWTEAELLGKNMHDVIHFQRADGTRMSADECPLLKVVEANVTYRTDDDVFTRKDGQMFPVSYTSSPVLTDGQVTGAVLAFRDMTERKQIEGAMREQQETAQLARAKAEASEEHYRFLAEAIPQQIWTAAPDGALDYVSQRVLDYFGSAADEVLGWGWLNMLHPDDVEACRERWSHSLETGETYEVEFRLRRASDESFRWHLGRALPLRDAGGSVVKWFGTNTDITERKEAEAELLRRSRQSALGAEVGVALAGSDSLPRILQRCAAALVQHLDTAFARIWTLNEREQTLELQASAGMYTHLDGAHGRVPVGEFKIGRIAASRQPHLTNAVIGDPEVGDQEWAKREEMVAFAGYPLIVGDRLLGVMAMFSRHPLTDDTLESLASIANTIAQGIERKRVEETIVRLSRERAQMLEEVSTPVVPVWHGVLVLPIIGSLDTARMQRATEAALKEVTRTGARACIIDITGARLIDSYAVANLGNLVQALRLVGAEAIVTGVSAHAAQSLVGLGLDLKGMCTYRTLAQALTHLLGGATRGTSSAGASAGNRTTNFKGQGFRK